MENIREIKAFIEDNQPTTVNIFSFAIQDFWDLDCFARDVKPFVERELGIKFHMIPTTDQIADAVKSTLRIQVLNFQEMCNLFGKQWAFIHAMKSGEHVLFDDAVDDCQFINAEKNLRLIRV